MRLSLLYEELSQVENSPLEFLPNYGYSPKVEIIQLIEEEIREVLEEEERNHSYDYTGEELESEREYLCFSQGLTRYT